MDELNVNEIMQEVGRRADRRRKAHERYFDDTLQSLERLHHQGEDEDIRALRESLARAFPELLDLSRHLRENLPASPEDWAAAVQEAARYDTYGGVAEAPPPKGLAGRVKHILRALRGRLRFRPHRAYHALLRKTHHLANSVDFLASLRRQAEINKVVAWQLDNLIQKMSRWEQLLIRWAHDFTERNADYLNSEFVQRGEVAPLIESRLQVLGRRLDEEIAAERRRIQADFEQLLAIPEVRTALTPGAPPGDSAPTPPIDNFAFESFARGAEEAISTQQRRYLPYFLGASNILDVGCGRGEFLQLLKKEGVSAHGIDSDPHMVGYCLAQSLDVRKADLIEHLRGLEDASLGGVFASQVIEHLPPTTLAEFCRLAFLKCRPGAPIALETVNPCCLTTFSGAFYADPTHVKPIHPVAIQFLLAAAGYPECEIHFVDPIPESDRLDEIPVHGLPEPTRALARALNANLAKLNSVLYTSANYYALARKPATPAPEAAAKPSP